MYDYLRPGQKQLSLGAYATKEMIGAQLKYTHRLSDVFAAYARGYIERETGGELIAGADGGIGARW